jgi:hypothetical protein
MPRQLDDGGGPCILLCLLPLLALKLTLLASPEPGTKDSGDRPDERPNKTDCELDVQTVLPLRSSSRFKRSQRPADPNVTVESRDQALCSAAARLTVFADVAKPAIWGRPARMHGETWEAALERLGRGQKEGSSDQPDASSNEPRV